MKEENLKSCCAYKDIHFLLCHNTYSGQFLEPCHYNSWLECDDYLAREEIDEKIEEIKKPKYIKSISQIEKKKKKKGNHYVHAYWGNSPCVLTHNITEYNARVFVSNKNYYITLKVFYCNDCNKFYVSGNSLPDRELLYSISNLHIYNMPADYYDFEFMTPKSILAKHGYSVRKGVSCFERQRILKQLVTSRVLSPYAIINHLNGLIALHYAENKWQEAIRKYREDIDYVNSFDEKFFDEALYLYK